MNHTPCDVNVCICVRLRHCCPQANGGGLFISHFNALAHKSHAAVVRIAVARCGAAEMQMPHIRARRRPRSHIRLLEHTAAPTHNGAPAAAAPHSSARLTCVWARGQRDAISAFPPRSAHVARRRERCAGHDDTDDERADDNSYTRGTRADDATMSTMCVVCGWQWVCVL